MSAKSKYKLLETSRPLWIPMVPLTKTGLELGDAKINFQREKNRDHPKVLDELKSERIGTRAFTFLTIGCMDAVTYLSLAATVPGLYANFVMGNKEEAISYGLATLLTYSLRGMCNAAGRFGVEYHEENLEKLVNG